MLKNVCVHAACGVVSVAGLCSSASAQIVIGDHYVEGSVNSPFAPLAVLNIPSLGGIRLFDASQPAPPRAFLHDALASGPTGLSLAFGWDAVDFSTLNDRQQLYALGEHGGIVCAPSSCGWVIPGFDAHSAFGLALLDLPDGPLAVATGLRQGIPSVVVYDMTTRQVCWERPTPGVVLNSIESIGIVAGEYQFVAAMGGNFLYQVSIGNNPRSTPAFGVITRQFVSGNMSGTRIMGIDCYEREIFLRDQEGIGRGTLTPWIPYCPADFSRSADPNDPDYGVPDGAVDASDFFYFLDQFVDGNLAVADLSGSSDPNDPAYGQADGVIDAADFFYFLDLFVTGCH